MKHFAQKLICLLLVLCMVMTMLPAALAEETVFEPEIPAAETQQAEAPAEVPAEIPAEVPAEVPAAVPAEVPAEPELPQEQPLFDEFVDPFTLTLIVPEAYQHMKVQLFEGFFMDDKMASSVPVALPEKDVNGNYVLTLEKSYIQSLNGVFHYIIREDDSDLWSNYIPLLKMFYINDADLAAGHKEVTLKTYPVNHTGYSPAGYAHQNSTGNNFMIEFTDEMLASLQVKDNPKYAQYQFVFDTPAFYDYKPVNEITTNPEILDYIREQKESGGVNADNMYIFTLGYSPAYHFEMPIVVFSETDLSSAKTYQEAAALIKADPANEDKITVHYQAQMHANEASGGEGALAIIHSLVTGEFFDPDILSKLNLYVIPRCNPDGAYEFIRTTIANDRDLNRDNLILETPEQSMFHEAYLAFMPEVVLDGHESHWYMPASSKYQFRFYDLQVYEGGNDGFSPELLDIAERIKRGVFNDAANLDIGYANYGGTATSIEPNTCSNFYSLYGSISYIAEIFGIGQGKSFYDRRTFSHYLAIGSMIRQAGAYAQEIKQAVAAERARIASLGSVYEQTDWIPLQHERGKADPNPLTPPMIDQRTGEKTGKTSNQTYFYLVASRTRPRATAYVFAKGESWTDAVVTLLDKQGISYYEIDPGSEVMLQDYSGTVTGAQVSEDTLHQFPNGAYVVTTDNVAGNVISMLFEPDNTDVSSYGKYGNSYYGTLYRENIVPFGEIRRYVHDLDDGKITLGELDPQDDPNPDGWKEWTSTTTLPIVRGNYRLMNDVVLAETAAPKDTTTTVDTIIKLDLNGHTITSDKRVLTLKNSTTAYKREYTFMGTGTIDISKATGTYTFFNQNSSNATDADGCVVNLDGDITVLCGSGTTAPVIVQKYCTFNFKRGTIKNAVNSDNGGAVRIDYGGIMNMYDGAVIEDCHAAGKSGGGVYLNSPSSDLRATFNMYGGLIKGCSAKYGGGVRTNGDFTMTGGSFEGCYIDPAGGYGSDVYSGTAADTPGVITIDGLVYKPWDSKTAIPKTSGNYYLCQNVTTTAAADVIPADSDIAINLYMNGQNITVTKARMLQLGYNAAASGHKSSYALLGRGTVDCSAVATLGSKYNGMLVRLCENATFTLDGPTVVGQTQDLANGQPLVWLGVAKSGTIPATSTPVTFNFKSGTIKNNVNVQSGNGSAVLLNSSYAIMNMYDGAVIEDCRANLGGGVYVSGGVCNMYGGTVQNCSAKTSGGCFQISSGGTLNMTGGEILNGSMDVTPTANNVYIVSTGGALLSGRVGFTDAQGNFTPGGIFRNNDAEGKYIDGVWYDAWTSATALPVKSGRYYLTKDVALTAAAAATAGNGDLDVTVDLNGYTVSSTARIVSLTGSANGRADYTFRGEGVIDISSENKTQSYRLCNLGMGKKFPTSLTIDGNIEIKASPSATELVIVQDQSVLTMRGCTVTGAEASTGTRKDGALATVGTSTSAVVLDGVTVNGSTAAGLGGVIYASTGKVTIRNCTFTNCSDKDGANVVCLKNAAVLESEGLDKSLIRYISAGGTTYSDKVIDGVTYTPWVSATTLPTTGGNFYLTQDVNMTAAAAPTAADGDIITVLNLDGKTIAATKRVLSLTGSANGTVDYTLCGEGVIDLSSANTSQNYRLCNVGMGVGFPTTLTIDGDILIKSTQNVSELILVQNGGTFNFKKGTVTGAENTLNTGKNGGFASIGTGSTMNLYDGAVIENCKASNRAGGIYLYNGTLNLYGGRITGCDAAAEGGALYAVSGTTLNILGGEFTGNSAERGGAIYSATQTKISGATITGNTARNENTTDPRAGGLAMNNFLWISDTVITGNKSLNLGVGGMSTSSQAHIGKGVVVKDNFVGSEPADYFAKDHAVLKDGDLTGTEIHFSTKDLSGAPVVTADKERLSSATFAPDDAQYFSLEGCLITVQSKILTATKKSGDEPADYDEKSNTTLPKGNYEFKNVNVESSGKLDLNGSTVTVHGVLLGTGKIDLNGGTLVFAENSGYITANIIDSTGGEGTIRLENVDFSLEDIAQGAYDSGKALPLLGADGGYHLYQMNEKRPIANYAAKEESSKIKFRFRPEFIAAKAYELMETYGGTRENFHVGFKLEGKQGDKTTFTQPYRFSDSLLKTFGKGGLGEGSAKSVFYVKVGGYGDYDALTITPYIWCGDAESTSTIFSNGSVTYTIPK